MSRIGTGTWMLFMIAALAGCKSADKANAADKGAASVEEAPPEEKAPDGPELDHYVGCFNEVDAEIRASMGRYVEWMPESGPTGAENPRYVPDIDDHKTKTCLESLDVAARVNGGTPLGPLTTAYKDAIVTIAPIVLAVQTYYEHKDYKDDGFARGKELHTQLAAAYAAWQKVDGELRQAWDAVHRERRTKALGELEQREGRKSERFVTALVMNRAEVLVETLDAEAPPAELIAAIDGYVAAFDEMNAFFGPELTAGTDTDRWSFKHRADVLLIQVKEAKRSLTASTPLPERGDGSPGLMFERYNDLVEQSNDITWD